MLVRDRVRGQPLVAQRELPLLAPCLLGYAVRLWAARGPDLGLDGGLSVALAVLPLPEALRFLANDVHPPLYYFVLRLWLGVAGTTALGVKYLGVAFGTLALAVLVGWVRSLAGKEAALASGALGAVAPAWVIVDVTVREYGLALVLLTALAWVYTRWSATAWRWFVVVGVVALWTSYLAIVVPVVAGVDAVTRRDSRRLWAVVVVGLSIVPWLAFSFSQGFANTLRSSGPRQAPVAADPIPIQVLDLLRFLAGGPALSPPWLGPILVVTALLVLVGMRRWSAPPGRASASASVAFVVAVTVAGSVLALAINTYWTRQGTGIRYTAQLLPFVLAGLGLGVAPLLERARLRTALVVAVIGVPSVLGLWAWWQRPPPPSSFSDPDALIRYLDARVKSDDAVVFVSPEQAGYYQVQSAVPHRWALLPAGIDYLQGDAAARARVALPPLAAQSRVIWLVLSRHVLGTGTAQIGDWLSLNAFVANSDVLPDSDVVAYVTSSPRDPPDLVNAPFLGGIRLLSANWPPVIPPGAAVPVALRWSGDGASRRDLRVFVHLVDASGRIVAQHDGVPENARAPVPGWVGGQVIDDRHGLLVPANLAPNAYWLEVGLYDDAGRLPLAAGGDTLRFGPIAVVGVAPTG